MKRRHVNTTIQLQKMKTSSVHYMIAPQFNYKLPLSENLHSLILHYTVLSQELYAAIFLPPHGVFRCGFLSLHHTILGSRCNLIREDFKKNYVSPTYF